MSLFKALIDLMYPTLISAMKTAEKQYDKKVEYPIKMYYAKGTDTTPEYLARQMGKEPESVEYLPDKDDTHYKNIKKAFGMFSKICAVAGKNADGERATSLTVFMTDEKSFRVRAFDKNMIIVQEHGTN